MGGPFGTRLKCTTKLALGTCATVSPSSSADVNGTMARLGTLTHWPSVNSAEQLIDLSRHVKLGAVCPAGTWPCRPMPEWSRVSPSSGRYSICAATSFAVHVMIKQELSSCWDGRSCQSKVGRSSPYYKDMWGRYCCLNQVFFRLSIHASVAKIQPDKVVRWCPDGDFLHHFCVLYFQRAAYSTF